MSSNSQISTLRPGILVSLKTSVKGNISYKTKDIEREHKEGAETVAKWETERRVEDANEYERAKVARSKARVEIARVCSVTSFGLLCPESNLSQLVEAQAEARRLVKEFNNSAQLTEIGVYAVCGRIAQDDVEAVRAINSEVRDLLDDMQKGIKELDASKVREAANKARQLGQMLTPGAQESINLAITAARKTARQIVKAASELAETGEQAATEIDRSSLRTLAAARTAFLDLDSEQEVVAPKAEGRTVDLAPVDTIAVPRRPRPVRRQAEVN